jgi:hypothetical protein
MRSIGQSFEDDKVFYTKFQDSMLNISEIHAVCLLNCPRYNALRHVQHGQSKDGPKVTLVVSGSPVC